MPLPLNITIDDTSPLITYNGEWPQSFSPVAFMMRRAYAGSYTSTTWQNASATFQFWGTWVMVNGSKNDYHGNYTVTLDGSEYPQSGYVPYPGVWNTSLFISDQLEPGHHTLIISNDEWQTLDIDSITWSCDVGGKNDTNSSLQTTTVDDKDAAFTYLPHGSWDMKPSNLTMFHGATAHSTNLSKASVNFTFSVSDAVAIYGTTGPGHSQYSVWPPDKPSQEFSASRDVFSSQVLLYAGEHFGPGNHTVMMVNEGSGLFQVDYAVVHAVKPSTLAGNLSSSRYLLISESSLANRN
ncbi:hypothetical protein B0H19DRAFT_930260 [Mycena capillaripes]|nr:hypothetical protein B0H19DRAFT_930260 [Mycena capillaripes]